ncbi:uncharacterized protein M6B38_365165 [Iris pallida]|uniref:Retrotransposon gag domain-containing protein n=1 Tax=Iris pallida TaxID=29817 RepID=A0AAX6GHK7_IRIPA|nr:uncharacterized protein M6B38_365165 [Iris pallida]
MGPAAWQRPEVEAVGLQLLDIARHGSGMSRLLQERAILGQSFGPCSERSSFPPDKIGLVRQFQNLQQGSMTVEEYAAEFGRLSRYAEYMVSDPVIRAERFREGLAWDIKILIPSFYATYAEVYAEARKVEREWGLKPKRDRDLFSGASSSAEAAKRPQLQHQPFQHQTRAPVQQVQHTQRGRLSMGLLATSAGDLVTSGGLPEEAGFVPLLRGGWTSVRDCPANPRRVARGAVAAQGAQGRPPMAPHHALHQQRDIPRQDRVFAMAVEDPARIGLGDADEGDYSTYYGPDDVVGIDLETLVQQGLAPPGETLPIT